MFPFHLTVEPLPNASYALTVFQRPYPTSRNGQVLPPIKRGSISGLALSSAWEMIFDALQDRHQHAMLQGGKKKRFGLSEESGVRLSLLFQVTAPLQDLDCIRTVQQKIWAMSNEEAYYWFAKCSAPDGDRGVRALRILHGSDLSQEQNT